MYKFQPETGSKTFHVLQHNLLVAVNKLPFGEQVMACKEKKRVKQKGQWTRQSMDQAEECLETGTSDEEEYTCNLQKTIPCYKLVKFRTMFPQHHRTTLISAQLPDKFYPASRSDQQEHSVSDSRQGSGGEGRIQKPR